MIREEELTRLISYLQNAFDVPEFMGELSMGRLKGGNSSKTLQASIQQLEELSRTYPDSPEIHFLSGIASRYLGDEGRFRKQVSLSLETDPNYLEALIARKEGEKYLDPFCYPSIGDLFENPNVLRPTSSLLLRVNGARLDQVRDGINIKPIFIIKSERSKFRRMPSIDMDMALGIEVCAVLPGSLGIPTDWKWPLGDSKQLKGVVQPFLDVLAGKKEFTFILATCLVLVDDPSDPFFRVIHVNLFPISMETYPFDYQPFMGKYEGLRLSYPPHKTAFVFLDEHNTRLLVKGVDLNPIRNDLLDAREVIQLLPDTPITLSEWNRAMEVHDRHYFYQIAGRDGRIYSVPRFRTEKERTNVIFSLTVRGNKIRAKHEQETSKRRELRYDVFVSHSHDDQQAAYGVTEWMQQLWPSIKIFMTSRDQRELDELVPGHYFLAAYASRCVLFLATPSSLKSSYALIELGSAMQLGTKVIGVLLNGSSLDDLAANQILGDLDLAIDLDSEDAETALLNYLGSTLHLQIPRNYKVGMLRRLLAKPRYVPDDRSSRQVNLGKIPDAYKLADGQGLSTEDALNWLDIVEKNMENKARMAGLRPELFPEETSARGRLIRIMMVSDDAKYDELLRPFAVLIDEEFCRDVAYTWQYAQQHGNPLADTCFKLLQAARRIVNGQC